jgi:hypothetical protein
MILEAVPAPPSTHQNTQPVINRTSRHYAGTLLVPVMALAQRAGAGTSFIPVR